MGEITTNIVIGFGDPITRLYTTGQRNIIITGSIPRPPNLREIELLKKWDEVWNVSGGTDSVISYYLNDYWVNSGVSTIRTLLLGK
jgi:hypothetical protein